MKVPQITALFWVLKLLTTGMGETMSDYLGNRSVPLAALIGVTGFGLALRLQLRQRSYRAAHYWFAVMMVAVFGTMVADGIRRGAGIGYEVTTPLFLVLAASVFAWWYRSEGTLSIHSIVGARRERFYWSAVLVTFALGTAAGDLTALALNLGYWPSVLIFGAMIVAPAIGWWRLGLNSVVAFWLAYVLTRPLGASIADGLGKSHDGGLGVGDGVVSLLALACFVGLVALVHTRDRATDAERGRPSKPRGASMLVYEPE